MADVLGRPRLKGQPSSRTGENPPYGMIGGIEETSASCEARSAPRSYPTGSIIIKPAHRVVLITLEEVDIPHNMVARGKQRIIVHGGLKSCEYVRRSRFRG